MDEITGITIPAGVRAMLVYCGDSGKLVAVPVANEASVLDIKRDLLKHLNDAPHTAEWLTILRDYCDARIAAGHAARDTSAVATPSSSFDWDITRIGRKGVHHG